MEFTEKSHQKFLVIVDAKWIVCGRRASVHERAKIKRLCVRCSRDTNQKKNIFEIVRAEHDSDRDAQTLDANVAHLIRRHSDAFADGCLPACCCIVAFSLCLRLFE